MLVWLGASARVCYRPLLNAARQCYEADEKDESCFLPSRLCNSRHFAQKKGEKNLHHANAAAYRRRTRAFSLFARTCRANASAEHNNLICKHIYTRGIHNVWVMRVFRASCASCPGFISKYFSGNAKCLRGFVSQMYIYTRVLTSATSWTRCDSLLLIIRCIGNRTLYTYDVYKNKSSYMRHCARICQYCVRLIIIPRGFSLKLVRYRGRVACNGKQLHLKIGFAPWHRR